MSGITRSRRIGGMDQDVIYSLLRRRQRYVLLAVLLLSSGLLLQSAKAAERSRPIRIGALTASWGPTPQVIGLRDGLRELGYRDHEHFILGVRFTQGNTAVLVSAARKLVQDGADLIFVDADNSAKAAQLAVTRVPIVFAGVTDPMGIGLVQRFGHPGNNITGVADLGLEISTKRLEIFREVIPDLKRVLYLYHATDVYSMAAMKLYRDAANHLGLVLVEQAVRTGEEVQSTLAQVRKDDVDGILAPLSLALNIPGAILEVASQRAIPTMFSVHGTFLVEHGGLASYGADSYTSGRQAARLVDKIRKGTEPAVIPVEVNSKIELVINVKTAQALGLTIAPEVLQRADRLVR